MKHGNQSRVASALSAFNKEVQRTALQDAPANFERPVLVRLGWVLEDEDAAEAVILAGDLGGDDEFAVGVE